MISIYLLKLEQGKYYVGKSKDPINRFEDHINGNGSVWTTKYKPVELVKTFENCDEFDEDKYTKIFMNQYGINNVRGGSYVQVELDDQTVKLLEREMRSANNICFKCGSKEHYILECPNKLTKSNTSTTCYKCGRTGHYANNCFAQSHINGGEISKLTCYRCGRTGHSANDCFAKFDVDGNSITNSIRQRPCVGCGLKGHKLDTCNVQTKNVCTRCGRDDHWKITCTAKQDINGYELRSHIIGHVGSYIKGWF